MQVGSPGGTTPGQLRSEPPVSSRHLTRTPASISPSPIRPRKAARGVKRPLLFDVDDGVADEPHGGEVATWRASAEQAVKAIVYGLINVTVTAPVMIGFAAIIFRNPLFHRSTAVYSQLVRLVLFSSAVHQGVFSATSTLPFAIGQVQDAGLIFLSKMADDTVHYMDGAPDEAVIATTLVVLSLSTACLGLALVLTGKLRLAALVQYLPLPVVGGYLAFIGLYCLEAGVSLMSGVQVNSLLGLDMLNPPTRFVVFDFTMVSGLNATAARSCFLNLCRTLAPYGIYVVFGGVVEGDRIDRLLRGHEILTDSPTSALRFDSIDEALEHCEDELLRAAAHSESAALAERQRREMFPRSTAAGLSRVLSPLVEPSWSDMLEGMSPFFAERSYAERQLIFRRGEPAQAVYFIVAGEVTLWEKRGPDDRPYRLVRYVDGGIFGEVDFFLRQPRSFFAEASSADCTLRVLTRDALQSMQSQASLLAAALEHALLKYLCFQARVRHPMRPTATAMVSVCTHSRPRRRYDRSTQSWASQTA